MNFFIDEANIVFLGWRRCFNLWSSVELSEVKLFNCEGYRCYRSNKVDSNHEGYHQAEVCQRKVFLIRWKSNKISKDQQNNETNTIY